MKKRLELVYRCQYCRKPSLDYKKILIHESKCTKKEIAAILAVIEQVVCDYYNQHPVISTHTQVTPERLSSHTRKREVVVARQHVMSIMLRFYNMSLHSVGAIYRKDHATALHARRTIDTLRDQYSEYENADEFITSELVNKNLIRLVSN